MPANRPKLWLILASERMECAAALLPGGWMECVQRCWYEGLAGRREIGTGGTRDWEWRLSNPSRHVLLRAATARVDGGDLPLHDHSFYV
jgi:hypothetical protein